MDLSFIDTILEILEPIASVLEFFESAFGVIATVINFFTGIFGIFG